MLKSLFLVLFTFSAATAGTITGFSLNGPVSHNGAGFGTSMPNNDDQSGPPNVLSFQFTFSGAGSTDIAFTVAPSGGTTEYLFIAGYLNQTGAPWTAMRFSLLDGTGQPITSGALDFDSPNYFIQAQNMPFHTPGSNLWTNVTLSPYSIRFGDGNLLSGEGISMAFAIDVPDTGGDFRIQFAPLNEASAVPEPSSVALVCAGIAMAPLLRTIRLRRK